MVQPITNFVIRLERNRELNETKSIAAIAVQDDEQFTAGVRRLYETMKQEHADYAVSDVPPLWLEGVEPQAIYPQECFYRAYSYATHLSRFSTKGIWLVHGECGLCFGCHAWVELPDGLVFDGVFQQFYRIEDWEKRILGRAWYKYTPRAAIRISYNMPKTDDGLHRLDGWHKSLKLPFIFAGTDSLEIDDEKAEELIVLNGLRDEADRQDAKLKMIKKAKKRQATKGRQLR